MRLLWCCCIVITLAGCDQSQGGGERPKAAAEVAPANRKQAQGVEAALAETLLNEFARSLREKTWENLRGPKDPAPIRDHIKTSVDFLKEKGFSPDQLAFARARAFDCLWDSLLRYAHTLVTAEADQYREIAPKFSQLCEELVADKTVAQAVLLGAVAKSKKGVIEWLGQHGVNLNARNANGLTALTFATVEGDAGLVETLLKAGADANVKGMDDKSPLMFAVEMGNNQIVKLLLAKGADPSLKTTGGQTALALAKDRNQLETVVLLKDAGAKE